MKKIVRLKKLAFYIFLLLLGLLSYKTNCYAKMADLYYPVFYIDDCQADAEVTGKVNYVDAETLKFKFFSNDSNGFFSTNNKSSDYGDFKIVIHILKPGNTYIISSKEAVINKSDQCHYFDLEITPNDIKSEKVNLPYMSKTVDTSDNYLYEFKFYLCKSNLNSVHVTKNDLIGSCKSYVMPWDDIKDDFSKKTRFIKADGTSCNGLKIDFGICSTYYKNECEVKIDMIDLFLENEPVYKGVDCSDLYKASISDLRDFDKLKLKVFKDDEVNLEQAKPIATIDEIPLIKDLIGADLFRFDFSKVNSQKGSDRVVWEKGKSYVFKLYDLSDNYLGCFNYTLAND